MLTPNATVYHTYTTAGNFTVSVNASNPLSAVQVAQVQTMLQNNYSTLCIIYPIANVTMLVPAYATTFTHVPVILNIVNASSPSCLFTVNDGSASWVIMGNETDAPTETRHFFVTSGTYTITANVSNAVSWMIVQGTVVVQTAPADLSILPMTLPVTLVDTPVDISVTLSQGTAVNVTIDFGDGLMQAQWLTMLTCL